MNPTAAAFFEKRSEDAREEAMEIPDFAHAIQRLGVDLEEVPVYHYRFEATNEGLLAVNGNIGLVGKVFIDYDTIGREVIGYCIAPEGS